MNLQSPLLTYLGFTIALLAMLCGIFEWFDPNIAWGLAGIFGFGGIAALRAFISSQGWKTYATGVFYIIPSILLMFNVINSVQFAALVALGASLTGASLAQGVVKAQNGV